MITIDLMVIFLFVLISACAPLAGYAYKKTNFSIHKNWILFSILGFGLLSYFSLSSIDFEQYSKLIFIANAISMIMLSMISIASMNRKSIYYTVFLSFIFVALFFAFEENRQATSVAQTILCVFHGIFITRNFRKKISNGNTMVSLLPIVSISCFLLTSSILNGHAVISHLFSSMIMISLSLIYPATMGFSIGGALSSYKRN